MAAKFQSIELKLLLVFSLASALPPPEYYQFQLLFKTMTELIISFLRCKGAVLEGTMKHEDIAQR